MTTAVVLIILAFFVVLFVISRGMSRRKEAAKQDLQKELERIKERDIMELVKEEAAATGADRIPGAEGVDIVVRLKVFHRDAAVREACPDVDRLRFVVDDDAPDDPDVEHVRLTFDQETSGPSPEDPEPAPGDDPDAS